MIEVETGRTATNRTESDVLITEGLLAGQTFGAEDIKEIQFGEAVECYGHLKIFDQTFDETFE